MKKRTARWMNIVVFALLALNVLAAVVMLVAQRASRHHDLFEDGTLRVETSPIAGTRLAHPHAYAENGRLVIKGCVQREPGATLIGSGQVQVSLRSSEGTALEQAAAVFSLSPDYSKSCARFRADLKTLPPKGTTAVLRWGLFTSTAPAGPTSSGVPNG
ncbi:MAG: hypothetical protein AMXMBFR13_26120 [Phycisphaerae bacterium]